jgi:N-acetylglucosamine transport system permease protein
VSAFTVEGSIRIKGIIARQTDKHRIGAHTVFIALFLLPACALYGLFVVWPVVEAFGFSLYRWRGVSESREFIGLENFRRLAADEVFRQSLAHNLLLLLGGGAAIMLLSLALAHALHGGGRLARVLRSVYLFPQIISLVVVAILWQFIFNPTIGALTSAMNAVGLNRWVVPWLGDTRTVLAAVGVVFVWHALGFYVMLFSAGLRTIPDEVWEAARLDGAEGLTRFRRVTLPLLWAVLRVALVYLTINALNIFALVKLMTDGQPHRASEVMLTYLYEQAFTNSDFGYATAMAVANFLIVMALSGFILLLFRRDPQEGAA